MVPSSRKGRSVSGARQPESGREWKRQRMASVSNEEEEEVGWSTDGDGDRKESERVRERDREIDPIPSAREELVNKKNGKPWLPDLYAFGVFKSAVLA